MAKFVFSAFADEITSDFNGQLEALERLGIPLLELRGVDGQNFTLLDDRQIDEVHKKLSAHKIGLSALGSPIGKITTGDDFDAHLRLFERIMDIGERLECRRIRMFSFYRGEGMTDEAHEREVFSRIEKLLEKARNAALSSATRTKRIFTVIRLKTNESCLNDSAEDCAPCLTAGILLFAVWTRRLPMRL